MSYVITADTEDIDLVMGQVRVSTFGKSVPIRGNLSDSGEEHGDLPRVYLRLRNVRVLSVKSWDEDKKTEKRPKQGDEKLYMNIPMCNNRVGETEEQARLVRVMDKISRTVSTLVTASPSIRSGLQLFPNLKPELIESLAETLQINMMKPLPEGQVAGEVLADGKYPARYFTPQVNNKFRRTQFWDREGNKIGTDVVKTWTSGFDCALILVEVSHVYQNSNTRKIVCYVAEAVVQSIPLTGPAGVRTSLLFPDQFIEDDDVLDGQEQENFKRPKLNNEKK